MSILRRFAGVLALAAVVILAAAAVRQTPQTSPRDDVFAAERAFAKTMRDRDHAAFQQFLSKEAVFFSQRGVLRGPAQVAQGWKPFFDGPAAPFSWDPDTVEVLESGTLALSSGPVTAADGTRSGTFTSIWRKEPDGKWRVVFDKGCPPCR
jgi:ketosteroid isomerase-like protein